jgi:hypothetical protein
MEGKKKRNREDSENTEYAKKRRKHSKFEQRSFAGGETR